MKSEFKNNKFWFCVDETANCKNNTVINIIARTVDSLKQSQPAVMAVSKLLETYTRETIICCNVCHNWLLFG